MSKRKLCDNIGDHLSDGTEGSDGTDAEHSENETDSPPQVNEDIDWDNVPILSSPPFNPPPPFSGRDKRQKDRVCGVEGCKVTRNFRYKEGQRHWIYFHAEENCRRPCIISTNGIQFKVRCFLVSPDENVYGYAIDWPTGKIRVMACEAKKGDSTCGLPTLIVNTNTQARCLECNPDLWEKMCSVCFRIFQDKKTAVQHYVVEHAVPTACEPYWAQGLFVIGHLGVEGKTRGLLVKEHPDFTQSHRCLVCTECDNPTVDNQYKNSPCCVQHGGMGRLLTSTLAHFRSSQKRRTRTTGIPHKVLLTPEQLQLKLEDAKRCTHCNRTLVLSGCLDITNKMSPDRPNGQIHYDETTRISCFSCNNAMASFDQRLVGHSLFVKSVEPSDFHEQTRTKEEIVAYIANNWVCAIRTDIIKGRDVSAFLNGRSPKDMSGELIDILRRRLEDCNWTCQLTGQKYCLCSFPHCWCRPSVDRLVCHPSSGHSPQNVQILSVALNRLKSEMSNCDFVTMLKHMREARALLPLPEPEITFQEAPTLKKCSRCRLELPLADFATHSKKHDGYGPFCKPCKKASR